MSPARVKSFSCTNYLRVKNSPPSRFFNYLSLEKIFNVKILLVTNVLRLTTPFLQQNILSLHSFLWIYMNRYDSLLAVFLSLFVMTSMLIKISVSPCGEFLLSRNFHYASFDRQSGITLYIGPSALFRGWTHCD